MAETPRCPWCGVGVEFEIVSGGTRWACCACGGHGPWRPDRSAALATLRDVRPGPFAPLTYEPFCQSWRPDEDERCSVKCSHYDTAPYCPCALGGYHVARARAEKAEADLREERANNESASDDLGQRLTIAEAERDSWRRTCERITAERAAARAELAELREAVERLPIERSLLQVSCDADPSMRLYRVVNEGPSERWERSPWKNTAAEALLAWHRAKGDGHAQG